jgi:hypothetical protein
MKWRFAGSSLLLIAALSSAGAQQVAPPDPLFKFDPQTRRQIQTLVDSAKLEGLPWNALRLKAIEGAAKKYKGKDVVDQLRRYYKALQQSQHALGPVASADEIDAGASVLGTGVNVEDLTQFRVQSETRSPVRALTYLADLISQHNVPRNDAVEAFTRLWKDGAAESDFDGLWRSVDQDILSGVSPRAALQSRMRSLPPRASKPPGEQEIANPRP